MVSISLESKSSLIDPTRVFLLNGIVLSDKLLTFTVMYLSLCTGRILFTNLMFGFLRHEKNLTNPPFSILLSNDNSISLDSPGFKVNLLAMYA